MSSTPIQLLLVEDNPGDARLIREMLNDEWGRDGYQIEFAGTVKQALSAISAKPPNMLLLDLSLPDSFGLDTFRRIQSVVPAAPIIVLTGNQDQELALSAVKEGAQDFLVKNDLTGGLLVKAIQYASERKQIEASLRVNEARFRSLAELSSDWYWEQDAEGRLIYVSEGLKDKSGIEPARFVGNVWWGVPGLRAASDWEGLRHSVTVQEPFKDLLLIYNAESPEPVFLRISGVPVTSDSGNFAGFRGVGKDVSARERIDAELRGSEERYRRIMDSARDGILMFDADGIVTFANLRLCSMLGYEEREICGQTLSQFVVSGNTAEAAADDAQTGLELRRKDGTSLWTMQITYPVNARDGSHAGTLSIFTDITEFKEREERVRHLAALAAEKSEAERANQAKSRFLAAVSHDLRQPMHAMGLFIEDLRTVGLDAEGAAMLDKMEMALDLTNGLLDSILMMSGLESGMVTPNVLGFPVQKILNRVQHAFAPMAQKKGLRLVVIPSDAIVRSDPSLLERVVFNLVSNALRYTDEGGVAVCCRQRQDGVHIQVWDTGLGIPKAYRDAIFQEFYRIEERGRNRGGLGLGLAIVQSCAALLGHAIDLASVEGRGSRFSVFVGRGDSVDEAMGSEGTLAAPGEDSDPQRFDAVPVLVIDDDQLLLESTAGLLRRWGCNVLTASTGAEAEACMHTVAGRVDLIVSDLRLADGEMGTTLIESLRKRFDPQLPALILTGDRSIQTAREVKRFGLTFLYKPVPPMRLKSLIGQLLGRQHPDLAVAPAPDADIG